MFYRCANDIYGYCSGKPKWDVDSKEHQGDAGYLIGGHCRLDPETCGKYQTFKESVTRQVREVKERIERAKAES